MKIQEEDRRILLVGGSGGLGRATAELLAAEGMRLVISYCRQQERAQQLQALGKIVQADITVTDDRSRLLQEANAIDGMVVFSGSPARVRNASELAAQMEHSHQVNYLGPVLLARELAEQWKDQGKAGSIVLFATMQGVGVFAGSTAYAGAKAALIQSAKILAKELRAPWNINVNVIAPGIIGAGMAEASIASGKYERYLRKNTIARYGRAHDVARAVRFLLEPDTYITGQVLQVDGGITL
jgi:NAD(P)-dependent dehydrogenase (short-subunit alcohol dehydrogenase family)